MPDPTWPTIYGAALPGALPPVARLVTERVLNPTCPTNCSGRHTTEAIIACVQCDARLFRLIAHEWNTQDAHYFYSTEALDGTPAGATSCPVCDGALRRVRP